MKRLSLVLLLATCAVAQTVVTLGGTSYALQPHPRVFFNAGISTGLQDPDGSGAGLARKATSANPAWTGTQFVTTSTGTSYTDINFQFGFRTGTEAASFALRWYSDNSQTASRTAALYMLDNIEKYVPFYCDELVEDCVSGGGTGYGITSYGVSYWLPNWIFAYELMRGEMTSTERQTFAAKILNDTAFFGGVDGDPATSCVNAGIHTGLSVQVLNGIMSSAALLFGSGHPIQVGDWVIKDVDNGYDMAHIVAITDARHATLSSNDAWAFNGYFGTISARRADWQAGDCGFLWHVKHDNWTARSLTGSGRYGTGGQFGNSYYHNLTISSMWGALPALLSVADDDVNFASRSSAAITALYNEWHDNVWALQEASYTGRHQTGETYGLWRAMYFYPGIAFSVANSTVSGPPVTSGVWAKNMLYQYFMNAYPSASRGQMGWGQPLGGAGAGLTDGAAGAGLAELIQMYSGTNEGKWANWWMQNRLSSGNFDTTPGTGLEWDVNNGSVWQNHNYGDMPWLYAWTDPAFAASDLTTSAPTAVALNTSDTGTTPTNMLISRTGYASVTDTLLNMEAPWEPAQDHNMGGNGFAPGSYKIFKGGYLLGCDAGSASDWTDPTGATAVDGGDHCQYLEVGGVYNLTNGPAGMQAPPFVSRMPRANTDGTNNRFAYAMTDATPSYRAGVGVSRAHRHLIDFKKDQQFVVVYDDVATAAGQMKRTYLHYMNNGGYANEGSTVFTAGSQSVVSSFNGFGSNDAAQLLSKVFSPSGLNQVAVYTDNSDGTYAGGSGTSFRVAICASADGTTCDASNTAAEFLVVHEPVAGAGNVLPASALITTDASFRGIQVGGSAPKVALFPRNGSTYASTTLVSTHTGTAQYAIAGMQAGTYTVSGPTSTSVTVGSDGLAYWEGPAGSYSIAQGTPPPPPPPPSSPGATYGGRWSGRIGR